MKFLLIVSAVIAAAVAGPTQRGLVVPVAAGPAVAPDPSTQVEDISGAVDLWPIAVGPAVIDSFEPVAIGPAIVDFPLTETGEVITTPAEAPVVVDAPAASPSAPLVQIILNINQVQSSVEGVSVAPVRPEPVVVPVRPEPVAVPEPIVIVDNWPTVDPVEVVEISPVQVVDVEPVAIAPVIVGTPIIPVPAVILPDVLN